MNELWRGALFLGLLCGLFSFAAQSAETAESASCGRGFATLSLPFRQQTVSVQAPTSNKLIDLADLPGSDPKVLLGITKSNHWYLSVGTREISGGTPPIP